MYMLLQNDWKNIDGIFLEKEYFLAKKKIQYWSKTHRINKLIGKMFGDIWFIMIWNQKMSCECMKLDTPE